METIRNFFSKNKRQVCARNSVKGALRRALLAVFMVASLAACQTTGTSATAPHASSYAPASYVAALDAEEQDAQPASTAGKSRTGSVVGDFFVGLIAAPFEAVAEVAEDLKGADLVRVDMTNDPYSNVSQDVVNRIVPSPSVSSSNTDGRVTVTTTTTTVRPVSPEQGSFRYDRKSTSYDLN